MASAAYLRLRSHPICGRHRQHFPSAKQVIELSPNVDAGLHPETCRWSAGFDAKSKLTSCSSLKRNGLPTWRLAIGHLPLILLAQT